MGGREGVLTTGLLRIGGSYALGVERYFDTSVFVGAGGVGTAAIAGGTIGLYTLCCGAYAGVGE